MKYPKVFRSKGNVTVKYSSTLLTELYQLYRELQCNVHMEKTVLETRIPPLVGQKVSMCKRVIPVGRVPSRGHLGSSSLLRQYFSVTPRIEQPITVVQQHELN